MTNTQKPLADLGIALGRTAAQLGELIGYPAARVQAWIDGETPSEEGRARLSALIANARVAAANGRIALHRQAKLAALAQATESATDRAYRLRRQADIAKMYGR
jgi:hypothetical protein